MLVLTLLAAIAGAEPAPCSGPVAPERVAESLATAEVAFMALDAEGFDEHITRARLDLGCVSAPIPPSLASAYHRIHGLEAWLLQDEPSVVLHFRSAYLADRDYRLPKKMAGAGHPLRDLYKQAAETPPGPDAPLPIPRDGSLLVDGQPSTARPVERPYVLQHLEESGVADLTVHAGPGDRIPVYPVRRSIGARPFFIAAAGTAVVAAGTYGAAGYGYRRFWDEDTNDDRLVPLRTTTNILVYTSAGVGAVALGLGVTAVALQW